jgi:hypothetical protein
MDKSGNWETKFGQKVSTSNELLDKTANIYVHEGEILSTLEINMDALDIL